MDRNRLTWRKASRSSNGGGACIELANAPVAVAVRDSKDPEGPIMTVDRSAFVRFAAVVKGL